jgi:NAD dependent epimerase/dehydratase family enzyme
MNKFLLEIGSFIIRTETELVLKSRNVIPRRLLENGFEFKFVDINDAFQNLIKNDNHSPYNNNKSTKTNRV